MRRPWRKRYLLMSLALALTCAVTFTAPASTKQSRAQAKTFQIAVFVSGFTSYTQPALAYQKKVFAGKASITAFNAGFDPQKMVTQCQDALTTGKYQGFLFYPVDGGSLVPCVKDAIKAGIKVASWDYPPIGPDALSEKIQVPGVVGMDLLSLRVDVNAAMTMVKRACGAASPCKVAMLIAVPTFGYTAVKRKLELAAFKKLPKIKVVSQSVIGFDAPDKAQSAIQTALQKTPDLNVVLSDDDSGLPGVVRALKDAGKLGQVKVIGDGANKYGVQAIRDGNVFGTVVALPKTGARLSTQLLLDALEGKPIKQRVIINQLTTKICKNGIVDRACAKKFVAEW